MMQFFPDIEEAKGDNRGITRDEFEETFSLLSSDPEYDMDYGSDL